jgi:hypothetical protein
VAFDDPEVSEAEKHHRQNRNFPVRRRRPPTSDSYLRVAAVFVVARLTAPWISAASSVRLA